MSETNLAEFDGKSSADRTVMHVLYGLHTLAWVGGYIPAVIAMIVNYIKRGDENDAIYLSHHNYMIRTFWWALLWFVLTSPLWFLFVLPGWIAWIVVGLWYLYRCIKGWLRFTNDKPA